MSKADWKDTEIRRLRHYQPLELRILRAKFPTLDYLLAELWDLHEASEIAPASRPVGANRGTGDINGRVAGGTSLRGGPETKAARDRIHDVNHDLRRTADRVFDGMDVTARRYNAMLGKPRRCRKEHCPEKGKRQYGMLVDGEYRCRTCNAVLGET